MHEIAGTYASRDGMRSEAWSRVGYQDRRNWTTCSVALSSWAVAGGRAGPKPLAAPATTLLPVVIQSVYRRVCLGTPLRQGRRRARLQKRLKGPALYVTSALCHHRLLQPCLRRVAGYKNVCPDHGCNEDK